MDRYVVFHSLIVCILSGHESAFPLPSAGIIPIMEMFCDGAETDEYGFLKFPHSKYVHHSAKVASFFY